MKFTKENLSVGNGAEEVQKTMVYIIIAVYSYLLANYFQSWIIFEYIYFLRKLGIHFNNRIR